MSHWRKKICLLLTGFLLAGSCFSGCGKQNSGIHGSDQNDNRTEASSKEQADSQMEETAFSSEHEETDTSQSKEDVETLIRQEIEAPVISEDEFPLLDGSTATLPLGRTIFRMCTGRNQDEADLAVQFTKTTNSYLRLMEGDADLLIAYEAGPKAKEDARYQDLLVTPIGLDALVFLCNEQNPVESLSSQQIKDIYTGKITNWKQVGGENLEMIAFQRPENSGSQTLMQNLMMKGAPMMEAPAEKKPSEMGELIDAVAAYENSANALGYSVYYYASQMHQVSGVRLMGVDGILPEAETIRSGQYGYVNPFYAVIRKDADKKSATWKLYEWLTGEDGQSLIDELGYVSVEEGGKKLPDSLNTQLIDFTTDQGILLLNGENFDGTAGVVVFDEYLHPVKRYPDLRLESGRQACIASGTVIPASKPVEGQIRDYDTYEYDDTRVPIGLFNLETEKWMIEPSYHHCYWKLSEDQVQYYLYDDIHFYDENPEPVPVHIYSANGEPEGTLTWRDYDDYAESCPWLYVSPELLEHIDGYSRYCKLGGSSFAMEGADGSLEIYIGGKLAETYDGALVLPFEGAGSNPSDMPYDYKHISPYNGYYDETRDEWIPRREKHLLIDEKGNIAQEFYLDPGEDVVVMTRDYLLTRNYENGRNQIRTYDGDLIWQWIYTEYGETEYFY